MKHLDYFGLESAEELFKEVQEAFKEYASQPTERLFLFLVFALNHLREWISGCSYKEVMRKKNAQLLLSKEELFFFEIWKLKEFQIINSFCNRGKHFLTKNSKLKTSKLSGFNCGTGKCSDTLGQEYFLIDGIDSRDIFFPVMRKYYLWFIAKDNGIENGTLPFNG